MWLQRVADFLLKHQWWALLITFAVTLLPVVGVAGILVAAFITLMKGPAKGGLFTLAATVPIFLSYYFSGSHDMATEAPIFVWAAICVAVISNLLTWVFAVMLQRQASWTNILQVAALLGVLVVSIVHLVNPSITDWWGKELLSLYKQAANAAKEVVSASAVTTAANPSAIAAEGAATEVQIETINFTKLYATGTFAAMILFNALLQLIAARWWQGQYYQRSILQSELHNIRLSRLAGFLFIASLVVWYLGNGVVVDIMPILFCLFAIAGLSVIHYAFGLVNTPMTWFWLTLVYLTLIIARPGSFILLAMVALLDIWFDLRKRMGKV